MESMSLRLSEHIDRGSLEDGEIWKLKSHFGVRLRWCLIQDQHIDSEGKVKGGVG